MSAWPFSAPLASPALGLTGLLTDPHHLDALWAVMLGSGQGASISLALMVMVLRSSNQHEAMALSGMAQGVGYLIASVGPTLLGAFSTLPTSGPCPWRCSWACSPPRAAQAISLPRRRPVTTPVQASPTLSMPSKAAHEAGWYLPSTRLGRPRGLVSRKPAGSKWSGTSW